MLRVVTGLPGNGKTLYALWFIQRWAKKENRPVWYHGIKGLKPELGWHAVPTQTETINGLAVEVPQWWLLPAGSIFIIDEAQSAGFGVRPRGMVPVWGQKLEVHRHLGIDGVFITQDPSLIDAHDRKLIEEHYHIVRRFGMQSATIHEFRPVRDNLKSKANSVSTSKWVFPKEVFAWYQSAELHTHKRRIPMKVWVLAGICAVLPIFLWFTWANYLDPHRAKPSQAVVGPDGSTLMVASTGAGSKKLTAAEWVREQQPRVAGLTYSAPAFDEVTKPVEAPYPAACVKMGSRCGCYSQQATKLDVPQAMCEGIVAGGFFVSWKQPLAQALPLQPLQASDRPVGPYAMAGAFRGSVAPVVTVAEPSTGGGRGHALPPSPMAR